MILGLPLLDAIYVLIRRILVHKPKSFGELMKINDTTHFHHQLLKLNLSRRQILLVEGGIALIIGSIAIATTGAMRFFGLILALTIIVILIVFINLKANKKELKKKEETPESKYSY
jgi:UDP-N-acetylmuramyl pentapeptide phosphotransferase/UDP-N-acetylglucosamine-1-phosphate transferase